MSGGWIWDCGEEGDNGANDKTNAVHAYMFLEGGKRRRKFNFWVFFFAFFWLAIFPTLISWIGMMWLGAEAASQCGGSEI